ncbi:MAG: hypothetical protein ACYC4U_11405 [Pirellulaceae bacterium]
MTLSNRPATGLECKLYYNAATHAAPTWTLISKAINVSYSISKGEADQSSRASTWKKGIPTLKDLEITFTYRKKTGTDAVFTALMAAALADTILEYAVMDAIHTEAGAQGIRAFCTIMSAGNSQDLESTEEVEFSLKPAYKEESDVEISPDWYTVGA